jgi:hypothetical protein
VLQYPKQNRRLERIVTMLAKFAIGFNIPAADVIRERQKTA